MRRLTERECRRYRTWYADARSLIVREYSNPELFIGLLAATSPRMHVKKNWKTAETIYKSVLRGGPINYGCGMKTHKPNIGRAIRGEPLSGLKVESLSLIHI